MPPNQPPYQPQAPQPQPQQPQPQPYAQPVAPPYQQPVQPYPAAATAQPFKDYYVWSALTMVFLSQIFGAIAFMYSYGAKKAYQRGDMTTAYSKANTAKIWCIVGTVAGVIGVLILLVLVASGALSN